MKITYFVLFSSFLHVYPFKENRYPVRINYIMITHVSFIITLIHYTIHHYISWGRVLSFFVIELLSSRQKWIDTLTGQPSISFGDVKGNYKPKLTSSKPHMPSYNVVIDRLLTKFLVKVRQIGISFRWKCILFRWLS